MRVISEVQIVGQFKSLASEMILADDYSTKFRSDWLLPHGWKAVPVEDGNHFRPWEVARIVPALLTTGYRHCIAIATEPMGSRPSCFQLETTEDDFRAFNDECGLFRFLLTEETRSWAISCNELYNVFAGEEPLVEALVGVTIEEARRKFLAFAEPLALGDPAYPMLKMAQYYAAF